MSLITLSVIFFIPFMMWNPIWLTTHFFSSLYRKIAYTDRLEYDGQTHQFSVHFKKSRWEKKLTDIPPHVDKIIALGLERHYVFNKEYKNDSAYALARLVIITENGLYFPLGRKFGHILLISSKMKQKFEQAHNIIAYYCGFEVLDRYVNNHEYFAMNSDPRVMVCASDAGIVEELHRITPQTNTFVRHHFTPQLFTIQFGIWFGCFMIGLIILSAVQFHGIAWNILFTIYFQLMFAVLLLYIMFAISILKLSRRSKRASFDPVELYPVHMNF